MRTFNLDSLRDLSSEEYEKTRIALIDAFMANHCTTPVKARVLQEKLDSKRRSFGISPEECFTFIGEIEAFKIIGDRFSAANQPCFDLSNAIEIGTPDVN